MNLGRMDFILNWVSVFFYAGSRPGFLKMVSCGVAEWFIFVFANRKKPKVVCGPKQVFQSFVN